MARNTGPAAKHTYRVLALATGSGDTNITNDHPLAVHTRMPMSPRACFFAFITVNTFVQVNYQHLGPLNDAIIHQ